MTYLEEKILVNVLDNDRQAAKRNLRTMSVGELNFFLGQSEELSDLIIEVYNEKSSAKREET